MMVQPSVRSGLEEIMKLSRPQKQRRIMQVLVASKAVVKLDPTATSGIVNTDNPNMTIPHVG